MKKVRNVQQEYMECDGCIYVMSESKPRITVDVPFDYPLEALREDPPRSLEFHFHADSDCFRYWAHNPRIMRRSLAERELSEDEIMDFLSLMLYREDPFHPGVERPKEKVA